MSFYDKAFKTLNLNSGLNILSMFFYVISGLIKFLLIIYNIYFYLIFIDPDSPDLIKICNYSGLKF